MGPPADFRADGAKAGDYLAEPEASPAQTAPMAHLANPMHSRNQPAPGSRLTYYSYSRPGGVGDKYVCNNDTITPDAAPGSSTPWLRIFPS